ncbi:hypothetical protein IAE37_005165 [Pseudomonas sp. S31]|uniref:LPS O-antigen chain length determinant protein WzzB n=1 Tax=Pseudomonas sp. S31 TaxID=1564473 RepID=UPI001911F822|nr:Wzz/FepE/Etk N-terminal domain-containing protein [Pseudomonas sp. S31]MBK5002889.1 hypothetical protein [Pseudomonas sp. S31]
MRNDYDRHSADEIDLFQLVAGIWGQKLKIAVTAGVITAIAIAYAFVATPIYEAKVFIQPPTHNDISQLNFGRGGNSGLSMITVKEAYEAYLRHLQSESLRREFFRNTYLPSLKSDERSGSLDSEYNKFRDVLTFGVANKDSPNRFFVKVNHPNPQVAAEWVVSYADMAGRRGVAEVVKDAKSDATIKAINLEQQIQASRESVRKQREDRIVQLTEALRVATSIGLDKPPIISNSLSGEVSASMDGPLTYLRGSKAIAAEIENLRNRTSDDPFVPNLRQRQEAVDFYRSLQVDPGVVQVFRQDGSVESPDKPIQPKKMLIILLGLIAGLLGGLLVGVIWHFKVYGMQSVVRQGVSDGRD